MFRYAKASAAALLCLTVAGGVAAQGAFASERHPTKDFQTGKVVVDGQAVNVSCSGTTQPGRPVVVLMAGLGDGLDTWTGVQQTLSRKNRVCSYDRLGEGTNDQPKGPQSFSSTGRVLTGVLNRVAGHRSVVLVGHSLGGLIAARYAPVHPDRVKGLVLLDATPSTMIADLKNAIPESATGPAGEIRAQSLAAFAGESPEKLVVTDGKVRSAGTIPVQVVQHGQHYLADVPEYGPALESAWAAGQRRWLRLSHRSALSTAANSGHYIHLDEPAVATRAVQRVVTQISR